MLGHAERIKAQFFRVYSQLWGPETQIYQVQFEWKMEEDQRDEFYLVKGAGITMEKSSSEDADNLYRKRRVWIKRAVSIEV